MGIAGGVVMDGDEAGNAPALLVFAAHRVAGPFGAIMMTSIVFFGSIRLKCTLRPWAKAIAAPSRMFGAISSR